ncbi:SDR family oxidoreductase [Mesorhizobium sp. M1403]|uniref:SDR family NAD(P)-dependent oxidoreductase n=1 Tax=Mesorhizobium sp. M1403 TaxID=2957097 RepID=UPI003336A330
MAAAKSGRIDICVANAGDVLVEDFATSLEDDWHAQVDVNLLGVMRTWQAALPFMGSVNGGRLIAVSSAAGVRGEPHIPTYSATKAAISGLVQALALKYALRSITVNCVAPGEIETMLNQEGRRQVAALTNAPPEAILQELVEKHIPLGRLGRADEVAKLIAYLASHEAAYITGQTPVLDGGQLLT